MIGNMILLGTWHWLVVIIEEKADFKIINLRTRELCTLTMTINCHRFKENLEGHKKNTLIAYLKIEYLVFFSFSDHVAIHSIDHLYTYIFFPGYIMLSEWQLWMTYCDRSYLFSCIVGNVDVGIWKGTSSQWHSHSILFSHIDVAWKLAERDNHFKV